MANPTYAANWELVQDDISYEYRNKVFGAGGASIIVVTTPQRRMIRTKTYEANIKDGSNEVPAPSYLAGDNYITANPENLSPVGTQTGKWHLEAVSYSKGLTQPCSRTIRVTWSKDYAWEDIE